MRGLKKLGWSGRRGVMIAAAGAVAVAAAAWPLSGVGQSAEAAAAPHTTVNAAAAAGGWTGTWAVSPQCCGQSFSNQTLRQIVHTSIGGASARVEISNVFGSQPLVVSDVHVAQRSSGSTITGGTDHVVTFGGQASTTIPVGGLAVSDGVSFTIPALADIAVSMYLPQGTGQSTYHAQGNVTNYVAGGDVSGNGTLSGAATNGGYYFLTNLDVQNSSAPGAIVTLGASITDGVASGTDDNRRWPNDLAVRLANSGRSVGVLNQGISGNRLLQDGTGPSAINRFSRDALQQPGAKWVLFADDPINDLGSTNPQPTANQLIAGAQQLMNSAHQAGLKFICATLTPYQGAGYWNQSGENAREAYDSWVRTAGNGCDAVADFDNATHDPSNPTRYLPAYNSGDSLHPNEAGLQAMANAVDLGIFGSGGTTPPPTPVISLRAHANGDYVTAENAGASPLIANRTAIGSWESFDLINNPDGSVSLRAHANGDIVTADSAGASALIANRTAIGPWEEFDLIHDN